MKNAWFLVSCAAVVLALGATLAAYGGLFGPLPESVPVHWNIRGDADQFVPRERVLPYLLILPGVMAGLVLLTLALPWLSPRAYDVNGFRPTYLFVMALVVLMMGYLQGVMLLAMLGVAMPFLKVYLGGLFLFLAALGGALGKVRRNFYMGVRTPWTLASEAVWTRTHRLAAWTFAAGGLAGFAAVALGADALVALAVLIPAVLTPVVYSLVIYKQLEREGRLEETAAESGARQ